MRVATHRWIPAARRLGAASLAAAAVAALAGLTACASPAPAANPTVDSRLAPGWEGATHALHLRGPGLVPGTSVWLLPANLSRGTYEVINRRDDAVQVLDGHRLDFDGRPFKDVLLVLPTSPGDKQLVDARFVSAAPKP